MKNKLLDLVKEFELKTGNTVVYLAKSGSRLYGTHNENSDLDVKGIFIPSTESLLLKQDLGSFSSNTNNNNTKNTKDDVDFTLHSIHNFFNQLEKSETGSMDLLYSMFSPDNILYEDKNFTNIIKQNKVIFSNSNMKSFIGYALGQSRRFAIKGKRYSELDIFVSEIKKLNIPNDSKLSNNRDLITNIIAKHNFKYVSFVEASGPKTNGRTNIEYLSVLGKLYALNLDYSFFLERVTYLFESFGNRTKTTAKSSSKVDFKALSHAFRISKEVLELLTTNNIKFPLDYANTIKEIKSGNMDLEEVNNLIALTLEEVDILLEDSSLPRKPNRKPINKLLLNILKDY